MTDEIKYMASDVSMTREPFTLYTVGYDDTCLISVQYEHGVHPDGYFYEKIGSVTFNGMSDDFNPTKIDGEPLCELFLSEEEAQYLIDDIIEYQNEIHFNNLCIVDDIINKKDGRNPYAPENLKIFKMPILPIETIE